MRRHRHQKRFRHRGNFFQFENPAAARDIRVQNIGRTFFQQRTKTGLGIRGFADHHRHANLAAYLRQLIGKLRLAGFFHPVQIKLGELFIEADRMHGRQAPVLLNQNIHIRPHGVAHGFHHAHCAPLVLLGNPGAPRRGQRIEFHRGESHFHHLLRRARVVVGLLHAIAPAVGVDADFFAHFAAKQVVHRLLARLADDIPHRLFDAADRAEQFHRTASRGVIIKCKLREVFNVERTAPHHIRPQRVKLRRHRGVAIIL